MATKPTLEQVESVRAVSLAMSALTEVWDENFNRIFEELGEEVTKLLLTASFDTMAWAWFQFSNSINDLKNFDSGSDSLAALMEFVTVLKLKGVVNLRIVGDCFPCGLPFDLADMHDCAVSDV